MYVYVTFYSTYKRKRRKHEKDGKQKTASVEKEN
jgi:hypothetical protein